MTTTSAYDAWSAGQNYEHYMGRWSRQSAARFVDWLAAPKDADWLEVGGGTGALTETILSKCVPRSIRATDQSADFRAHASSTIDHPRARFEVADARKLPAADASMDVVSSALVLNFIPDKAAALTEMQRVLRPGGLLSFYVWDYPGGGIGFIDEFWKSATAIDPKAAELDEATRFPFCTESGLTPICREAGIRSPTLSAIEIVTEFTDFEAFWKPFTLKAGPAPGYCMSLSDVDRQRLKSHLAHRLGLEGPVRLKARAWAVKAVISRRGADGRRVRP
jgi:SAM-dependent methyltransferase